MVEREKNDAPGEILRMADYNVKPMSNEGEGPFMTTKGLGKGAGKMELRFS
jgi:hypothetical protein